MNERIRNFKNAYSASGACECCAGEAYSDKFETVIRNGCQEYVEKGREDTYGLIQALAQGCGVGALIERYTASGGTDISGFCVGNPKYLDLTELPKNDVDAFNAAKTAKDLINVLFEKTGTKDIDTLSSLLVEYQKKNLDAGAVGPANESEVKMNG